MSVGHLYSVLGAMSVQAPCPFFNSIAYFIGVKLYELIMHFGYQPLVICIICKYILPFSRWLFHFVDGFLCVSEVFSLMKFHVN